MRNRIVKQLNTPRTAERGSILLGICAAAVGIGAPTWAGVGDFDGDNRADIAWYENWKAAITVFNGGKGFGPNTWKTGIGGPDWANGRDGSLPASNGS